MALNARNRTLRDNMEAVIREIEELRAELARIPVRLHNHRVYLDRVESLAFAERHLKYLDSRKEIQASPVCRCCDQPIPEGDVCDSCNAVAAAALAPGLDSY